MADRIYKYSIHAGESYPDWEAMYESEELGAKAAFTFIKNARPWLEVERDCSKLLVRVIEYKRSSLDTRYMYSRSWFF